MESLRTDALAASARAIAGPRWNPCQPLIGRMCRIFPESLSLESRNRDLSRVVKEIFRHRRAGISRYSSPFRTRTTARAPASIRSQRTLYDVADIARERRRACDAPQRRLRQRAAAALKHAPALERSHEPR